MSKQVLPKRFRSSDKQIKKMQLAFEFGADIEKELKLEALDNGLSPTAQLRKILCLPGAIPVKPRLSVTLSDEDLTILAKRYHIDPNDRAFMRLNISREIENYYPKNKLC